MFKYVAVSKGVFTQGRRVLLITAADQWKLKKFHPPNLCATVTAGSWTSRPFHEFNETHHSVTFHFTKKRLQTMLWHHNARVNSHQRWKQTRFRVCFHVWCELTSTMNVTEWQVSWNSCSSCIISAEIWTSFTRQAKFSSSLKAWCVPFYKIQNLCKSLSWHTISENLLIIGRIENESMPHGMLRLWNSNTFWELTLWPV